jgi:hypothetical protein
MGQRPHIKERGEVVKRSQMVDKPSLKEIEQTIQSETFEKLTTLLILWFLWIFSEESRENF